MSKNNKASNYNEKMLTRLRIQFIVLSKADVKIMQGFWMALSTTTKPIIWQNYSKNTHLVPL